MPSLHSCTPEIVGNKPELSRTHLETHDWIGEPSIPAYIGSFGFTTTLSNNEFQYQRIIQLGYAVGDAGSQGYSTKKCSYVQPQGFEVSEKATNKCHGITQATVQQEGLPLRDVLVDFLKQASDVVESGGALVAHQLEFDAGNLDSMCAQCYIIPVSAYAPAARLPRRNLPRTRQMRHGGGARTVAAYRATGILYHVSSFRALVENLLRRASGPTRTSAHAPS